MNPWLDWAKCSARVAGWLLAIAFTGWVEWKIPLCGSACVAHDGDTWRCFAKGHTFIKPVKRWITPDFVTQLLALSAEARAAFERAVGRRAA